MNDDKQFYGEFLSELKALDDYLLRTQRRAPYVNRTDPDVRRLMESMAFFAARTRQMSVAGFTDAVMRIAQGHLEEMMRARPSRWLVRAQPGSHLVEPVRLAKGTTVRVIVDNQAFGTSVQAPPPIVGLFSTTGPSTIFPMEVKKASMGLRPGSGFRIMIELRGFQPIRWSPDPLSFHTSVLGDYERSRAFLHALQAHLVAASVVVTDDAPTPDITGPRCEVRFGPHPLDEHDEHADLLASVARFLHFPEEELFFHVYLPERERTWRRAYLCLDMDEGWPASMVVNKDIFQLFVFPVSNVRREAAEPILCDGTKDRYPVRPVGLASNDSLHQVAGVYREVETGWQPILPRHLSPVASSDVATFEVVSELDDDGAKQSWLLLEIPDAFENPCKIAVDAFFHQPWFDDHARERLRVTLQTRKLEGVRWELLGTLREHRPSPILGQAFEILHLLSLMGQPVLDRADVMYVLEFLGVDEHNAFAPILDRLARIRITEERTLAGDGTEYIYHVYWRETDDDTSALEHDLCTKLEILLDAWSRRPVRVISDTDSPRQRKRQTE